MADYYAAPRAKSKTMPGNEARNMPTTIKSDKLNAAGIAKYKSRLNKLKTGGT